MRKRILAILTMGLIVVALMALNVTGPVAAKISTVSTTVPVSTVASTSPTTCVNRGGGTPGGQQGRCEPVPLTETATTTASTTASTTSSTVPVTTIATTTCAFATNPAGHKPGGQQC